LTYFVKFFTIFVKILKNYFLVTFVTDIFYLIPYNYVVIDLIYPSPRIEMIF